MASVKIPFVTEAIEDCRAKLHNSNSLIEKYKSHKHKESNEAISIEVANKIKEERGNGIKGKTIDKQCNDSLMLCTGIP
jgi:hypothetical protein